VAWARAARTLVVLGIVAWVGWKIYQRYGATARTRFEDWVARTRPKAAEVVELVRGSDGARFADPTR
jgi:predicted negative regulator of RcsB-dependent stress response